MKILGFIPARSGSKELKNKNLKKFNGKPLIYHTISISKKFKTITTFVSTDSKKYARISKKFGPVKIILRPKKISKDNSTDYEMIKHLVNNIDENYDFIAHIRPTSPQREIKDLKRAFKVFVNSNFSSLRSVHEMSETAYKMVEIKNGHLKSLKN